MPVRPIAIDRASGVLLAAACGDALSVPYGYVPPVGEAVMKGGGSSDRRPGEWSDDTQLTLAVARVAADGHELTSDLGLDLVAEAFLGWARSVTSWDEGSQTRVVLADAEARSGRPSVRLAAASADLHARTHRTAGNGALMRTAVVGITHTEDRDATAASARAVAALTHADPLAADSCVLWSEAIRVALVEDRLDVRSGLDLLDPGRRDVFEAAINRAEDPSVVMSTDRGYTVDALEAAWSAIIQTDRHDGSAMHLQRGLQAAVRSEHLHRSVASIAGALLGARYGASAVPTQWRRLVHGWPGMRAHDVVELAASAFLGGRVEGTWPSVRTVTDAAIPTVGVPHPIDPDIILGSVSDLARVGELDVDAVISVCALGLDDIPAPGLTQRDHIELWLNDADESNPHLDFVLDDASSALRQFRAEDKRVLVHSRGGTQRVAAVALRYAVDLGVAPSLAEQSILETLTTAQPTGRLWQVAAYGA